jgi:2-polyprenyl-6-methoxyphenol hydroxylase-like FAD-dependent oxidoreductase
VTVCGPIAIVGAGIGGLAAAALLAARGQKVTIFDRFEAPRPVGSGLVIQPVGLAVLDRIGVGSAARTLGAPIWRMLGHEARSGKAILDVSYGPEGGDLFGLAIHRASLFHALHEATRAQGVPIVTSAAIAEAPWGTSGRELVTTDRRRFGPFALVIDAAGAGSALSPLTAKPLPYGAIWGTVPWPKTNLPADRLSQRYLRAEKMAGIMPLGHLPGQDRPLAAIFWSLPRRDLQTWRERPLADWKAEVTAFWPDFAPFLETIRNQDDMVPAFYSHGTLRQSWGEGIVHIGDAAHRASPQLGQGANMALLDALALSEALASDADNPLGAYGAMRRWHVRLYQAMSRGLTPQYQSDSSVPPLIRDHLLVPLSHIPPMPALLSRLVRGDLIPPIAGRDFP